MTRLMVRQCRASVSRLPALDRQRVFGVGGAKTGTNTVGAMFAGTVPSLHEADAEDAAGLTGIGSVAAPPTTERTLANPSRFGVLSDVPTAYLVDVMSEACGEWIERFVPDEAVAAAVAQLSLVS